MRRIAPRCQAAAVPEPPATSPGLPTIDETLDYVKFVVPLAALVTVDKVLAAFLAAQGVTFPAPIIGMFGDMSSKPSAAGLRGLLPLSFPSSVCTFAVIGAMLDNDRLCAGAAACDCKTTSSTGV